LAGAGKGPIAKVEAAIVGVEVDRKALQGVAVAEAAGMGYETGIAA
jgi:hypothetical protein